MKLRKVRNKLNLNLSQIAEKNPVEKVHEKGKIVDKTFLGGFPDLEKLIKNRLGWTQKEIGESIGMPKQTLNNRYFC